MNITQKLLPGTIFETSFSYLPSLQLRLICEHAIYGQLFPRVNIIDKSAGFRYIRARQIDTKNDMVFGYEVHPETDHYAWKHAAIWELRYVTLLVT